MSNLKNGVCKDAFWLDKEQCCWNSDSSTYDPYGNVICDKVGWEIDVYLEIKVLTL